jgi:hypothetical protein
MHSKRWSDAALIIKVFEEEQCWAQCLPTRHNNLRRARVPSYHSSSMLLSFAENSSTTA